MSQKKTRILLAESGAGEASQTIREVFRNSESGLELTTVSTVATLLASIKMADPEAIFLDLTLSANDPVDAVRVVRRSAPGVPLIVFASPRDKQYAAQSLTEGAMDYMLKGFMDARTVDRVLRAALERNTFEGLADLLRDSETGLYTRDGLLTLGTRFLDEAQRTGGTLVLVCALFENLQTLKQGFGPGSAEHALRDVARLLAGCCRRSDVVARLGDAQFVILAVDAAAPTGEVMRQRVASHLAVHNAQRSPWGPIELRFSTGCWSPQDGRSFAEFLDAVESELRQVSAFGEAEAAGL